MAISSKVFISYAREDQVSAVHLHKNLKKLGVEPWLDATHLIAGLDWRMQIEEELDNCNYVILLLSHYSIEKNGYVQAEKRYILDRLDHMSPGAIFLIPARLEECNPRHRQLKKLHRVDLFPSWNKGLKEIAKALKFSDKEIEKVQFTEPAPKTLSNKDYFEIVLPTMLRFKGEEATKLNKKVRFVIGDEYIINLGPPVAGVCDRSDQSDADLKLSLSPECMQSILAGDFDAKKALADGEVKWSGELSLLKEVGMLFQSGSNLKR